MIYNNFSDQYKKVLINTENGVKELWYKELTEIDILIWILKESTWAIREIFSLYWINISLIEELGKIKDIMWKIDSRKWVYSWMNNHLKETILLSVKIASSFSKPKASVEDFLLALIKNNWWFNNALTYTWINPLDIEKNLVDLNKIWTIDWMNSKVNWWVNFDEPIDKIIWAVVNPYSLIIFI